MHHFQPVVVGRSAQIDVQRTAGGLNVAIDLECRGSMAHQRFAWLDESGIVYRGVGGTFAAHLAVATDVETVQSGDAGGVLDVEDGNCVGIRADVYIVRSDA